MERCDRRVRRFAHTFSRLLSPSRTFSHLPPRVFHRYGDLLEMGVLDPATVTQQAVLNSCSIAASVITTSALITEVEARPHAQLH